MVAKEPLVPSRAHWAYFSRDIDQWFDKAKNKRESSDISNVLDCFLTRNIGNFAWVNRAFIKPANVFNQKIPGKLDEYQDRWCPGSLGRQIIINHINGYAR